MRIESFVLPVVALFVLSGARNAAAQTPDEIRRMIEAKAQLRDLGGSSGNARETESVTGVRGWYQRFQRGVVYWLPRHGVFAMSHAMQAAYRGDAFEPQPGPGHQLGLPISDELACTSPSREDRYQLFERGTIFWRAAESRYSLHHGLTPNAPGNCQEGPRATVVRGTQQGERHRYRISIIGFTVNRQTADDPLEGDGKGDEVYISALVSKFQSNGELESNTLERSALMGDINRRAATEGRVRAGSLSDQGGLGEGDTFMPSSRPESSRPTLPWVVYEGDLITDFNALTVVPFIWEWDENDRALRTFENLYMRSPRPSFFYGRSPTPSLAGPAQRAKQGWVTQLVQASVRAPSGIAPPAFGTGPIISVRDPGFYPVSGGDQLIGCERVGEFLFFMPKILFLTDRLAQRVVTTRYPRPSVRTPSGDGEGIAIETTPLEPGIVPIHFNGIEGNGNYTLYMKVEQL